MLAIFNKSGRISFNEKIEYLKKRGVKLEGLFSGVDILPKECRFPAGIFLVF